MGHMAIASAEVVFESRGMILVNRFVSTLLRSRLHRILSGSTGLVRYTGRRSGRTISTPTQYARHGDDVVILVARHESKSWWRNFLDERDIEILVQGSWLSMTARAVIGADEPDVVVPLLETYLERFPKAARVLGEGTTSDRAQRAVVVWCRP